MKDNELAQALITYRALEEKKKLAEAQQKALKAKIEQHMIDSCVERVESTGVRAQYVPRTEYSFDIPAIIKAVPEAINAVSLTNTAFEKLYKGNEALIGALRTSDSSKKTLTITIIKDKPEIVK